MLDDMSPFAGPRWSCVSQGTETETDCSLQMGDGRWADGPCPPGRVGIRRCHQKPVEPSRQQREGGQEGRKATQCGRRAALLCPPRWRPARHSALPLPHGRLTVLCQLSRPGARRKRKSCYRSCAWAQPCAASMRIHLHTRARPRTSEHSRLRMVLAAFQCYYSAGVACAVLHRVLH